jgi:hypothetical protein
MKAAWLVEAVVKTNHDRRTSAGVGYRGWDSNSLTQLPLPISLSPHNQSVTSHIKVLIPYNWHVTFVVEERSSKND